MEALYYITNSNDLKILSSIGFKHDFAETENERINLIYDYCIENFIHTIKLKEISSIASVSPNFFCRYFKSCSGNPFTRFLIEIRVGHACKLLIENNLSIKQLCYESGFNNFTSFHK
jgi:AraC-like DNA-binding protein